MPNSGCVYDHLEVDENGAARVISPRKSPLKKYDVTDAETVANVAQAVADQLGPWGNLVSKQMVTTAMSANLSPINEVAKNMMAGLSLFLLVEQIPV